MSREKPKFARLDREEFVKSRYKSYLEKKEYLDKLDPNREVYVLTDLDKNWDHSKPIKDIVICDRCNENIEDAQFIMLENNYVYHEKCCENDPWMINKPAEVPVMTYDNVIRLFGKK